ncbi:MULTISPECIES: hypothetical protein [Caballeronia]|jgi:hypothetical protein|uniref:Uncharacterized protein n=1 Tax=Caballeronia zhejiangensis TaxID=871203 RepID=A0A656QQM9_9BURK|nr:MULTISPECIES: hypothetical protein [Caballeronia]EKS69735.1 hypothetical protein BURK_016695 [Burkholderia sp. SJ98]KDR32605.1 hypothetical protein BG60_20930 [Caballeronia zhejiangensis]MDR5791412.1 hypothetical protein [Caballeronia sp. LP003]MDR5795852.1 hypothetical protein [Caballeronia sp. LZ008]
MRGLPDTSAVFRLFVAYLELAPDAEILPYPAVGVEPGHHAIAASCVARFAINAISSYRLP